MQIKQTGNNLLSSMTSQQKHEMLYRMKKITNSNTLKKLEKKMKDEIFTEVDLAVEFNCAIAMQVTKILLCLYYNSVISCVMNINIYYYYLFIYRKCGEVDKQE
jgi:hypothetical protein